MHVNAVQNWCQMLCDTSAALLLQLILERVPAMVTLPAARDAVDMHRDHAVSLDWGLFFGQLSL